ncbi:pyridoxamine 5'-phosphate oxidase [Actinosynnema sp. CA-248983]
MTVMDQAQREKFLAGVHVGVIAISRAEGPPLAGPVWYHYEPGGDVLVQMLITTVKYRLAKAAGEFSLVAQVETPPYKYVSVSGPVVGVVEETPWAEIDALARRYFDPADADEYLKSIEGEQIATFSMRPRRWYSADYS